MGCLYCSSIFDAGRAGWQGLILPHKEDMTALKWLANPPAVVGQIMDLVSWGLVVDAHIGG